MSCNNNNLFAKIYLRTVRPIRLCWLCKDDFVRGIYKLWANTIKDYRKKEQNKK